MPKINIELIKKLIKENPVPKRYKKKPLFIYHKIWKEVLEC